MRTVLTIVALTGIACGGPDTTQEEAVIVLDEPASGGGEATASTTPDGEEPELVVGEDACQTDADCVPAGCCHAAACVAQTNAPSCEDTMCTTDCQYGTLDCGGGCLCHEGRCAARLSRPPEMSVRE